VPLPVRSHSFSYSDDVACTLQTPDLALFAPTIYRTLSPRILDSIPSNAAFSSGDQGLISVINNLFNDGIRRVIIRFICCSSAFDSPSSDRAYIIIFAAHRSGPDDH
jgi:hypothetical protein